MNTYVRLRPHFPDEPIVQALTDTDFYKFTMGQFIFDRYRHTKVTFGFKNRTTKVPLAQIIPEAQLREELDHVRRLRFTNSEIHYLRGTDEYNGGKRTFMFSEGYLQFLREYQAPAYNLEYRRDEIRLNFDGEWVSSSPWEIYGLKIINELYYRALMKKLSTFERDVILAEGKKRLAEKIKILKAHLQIIFSEFGTRRTFGHDWQDYVVAALAEELLPSQFRGTSNVFLAQKYGLLPMGTNAHELQMVIAGLYSHSDNMLRNSQRVMLNEWEEQFGEPLSIFLPDTYSTKSFLKLVDPEKLRTWKGFRQDSGDPFAEGELIIRIYKKFGIDPRTKMIIFSDGLDLNLMIALEKHFRGRIMVSFGWGTNLTNDVGFGTLSLVIKAIEANGVGLVKLGNNPAKGMGSDKNIARYIQVFGVGRQKRIECKV